VAAATWLLFVLGLLGAADVALFHMFAHGIRHHPGARKELVAHALRGPTYAALFVALPNLALEGGWFWGLLALLAFDLGISIADFAMEGESRRDLGGLPPGEYVLHTMMAMLFGAMVASILFAAGNRAWLPARVAWEPVPVPDWLRILLGIMAVGVLASGIQDAVAAVRLAGPGASRRRD